MAAHRWLVSCKHKHKLVGWIAGAVEESAESRPHVLRHLSVALGPTLAKKSVRLVHKEQHPAYKREERERESVCVCVKERMRR